MFKKTSNQDKRFKKLIEEISEKHCIDKPIILHFVNSDLERVLVSNSFEDKILLSQLEKELLNNQKNEAELKRNIVELENLIIDSQKKSADLSSRINEKNLTLQASQQEISKLESKLKELSEFLRENVKKTKQLEYDVMMNDHAKRNISDKSLWSLKLLLAIVTVVAIIIVILLIYAK